MVATAKYAEQDERMTAHRRETKYLVTVAQARAVAAAVDGVLASHRHRGDGANQLPAAHHYVTTTYFDTASRALYRAAISSTHDHLKLRAKEYYDLHPALTENVTHPRQLVRFQAILWLEIKGRDGKHTHKQRLGIPKCDVAAFFANGTITDDMVRIQETAHGERAHSVLDAVAALCASCNEPLRADCLVNYRRNAWQDEAGEIRVTIDSGLASFAPPPDLWQRNWALVRETLGTPVTTEKRRVLEIKSHGELPGWLTAVLYDQGIEPVPYSKFEAASSAVHG